MTREIERQEVRAGAPIPYSFWQYVKSMGPGIVVVMTWMGAGDLVESAIAGGHYGYALMWAFSLCLIIRYLFVSIIAKYELCNPRSEGVLGGLTRLHSWFAPLIFVSALILGHGIVVYLLIGTAQVCIRLTGLDNLRLWAVGLSILSFLIVFRPVYKRLEKVFFVLTGVLTVSLLSLAGWTGPSVSGMARGLFGFAVPETIGRFDAVYIAVAMVGAVGGGLANLMYPYFMREKGWLTAAHRRVQNYDLLLGIIVLIILDLSVWVIGAEILHPKGLRVTDLESLALLLAEAMGKIGGSIFYIGVFAALFTSILGNGAAFGYLAADAYLHARPAAAAACGGDYKEHPIYQWIVGWVILSPLFWIMWGHTDFVGITILVNAAQVIIIPVLVLGIWIITSKAEYIGRRYRNRWWENVFIGFLLVLGCIGAYFSTSKVLAIVAGRF